MQKIGFGFDSHRFAPDRALVLGGVRVEGADGLAGHSDADVVLHAITDAVLGAMAAGDIGEHFPDTDATWKNADSGALLAAAVKLASEAGLTVGNCDVTVIAERPKLTPHKPAMRQRIAELLGVDPSVVSVKAKTNEQMGFVGRGEGIVAMAAVLLCSR